MALSDYPFLVDYARSVNAYRVSLGVAPPPAPRLASDPPPVVEDAPPPPPTMSTEGAAA